MKKILIIAAIIAASFANASECSKESKLFSIGNTPIHKHQGIRLNLEYGATTFVSPGYDFIVRFYDKDGDCLGADRTGEYINKWKIRGFGPGYWDGKTYTVDGWRAVYYTIQMCW